MTLPDLPTEMHVLTPDEAVAYLIDQGQTWATRAVLNQARRAGNLVAVKIGKTYCYQLQAIFDWLEPCQKNPNPRDFASTKTDAGTSNGEKAGATGNEAPTPEALAMRRRSLRNGSPPEEPKNSADVIQMKS